MKLIKQSSEILHQEPGILGIYKMIEKAGRTCYKSEDKITEDSAKAFVDKMIKSGHGAMLEHGTVYLAIPINTYAPEAVNIYRHNSYSRVNKCDEFIFTDKYRDKAWCVTTNLRVLVENDCLEDLEFFCEPTEYHERRVTVKLTTDQGILREFTRHRTMSFACESTRYCNYSKDRFNNEITFILPCWCNHQEDGNYGDIFNPKRKNVANKDGVFTDFIDALYKAEHTYLKLLEQGWKPQQARNVLPLATKCELIMTGFVSDWKHFFSLRCPEYGAKGVHPQAAELATMVYNQFKTLNYVKLSSRS